MRNSELDIVTGAFSYTGRYITKRLLAEGKKIRTLTGHPQANPFGSKVSAFPYVFDNPGKLEESLKGAATFYNTYWIRFPRGKLTFDKAVSNNVLLIEVAAAAGIKKFVQVSITNPFEDSTLPYFRGKALVEKALIHSGLSYAIIRPTVIFGVEDILINNIAWLLRRFPVFAIVGSGEYRIRPVFVEDVADLAVSLAQKESNAIVDAVGPEVCTFEKLIRMIARQVHSKARLIHVPPSIGYVLSRFIGLAVGDVLLTRDEIVGLMSDLLVTDGPATCKTRFSQWLERNADTIGGAYASELRRHYR
jgi:uncharacterized protein YbjT (DUF2867 family)